MDKKPTKFTSKIININHEQKSSQKRSWTKTHKNRTRSKKNPDWSMHMKNTKEMEEEARKKNNIPIMNLKTCEKMWTT